MDEQDTVVTYRHGKGGAFSADVDGKNHGLVRFGMAGVTSQRPIKELSVWGWLTIDEAQKLTELLLNATQQLIDEEEAS